jgi:hypothetical protein
MEALGIHFMIKELGFPDNRKSWRRVSMMDLFFKELSLKR